MTDTYLFFADWSEPEIDPLAPALEVIEVDYEAVITAQNALVAVAYPGDWLTVYGGSDDAE